MSFGEPWSTGEEESEFGDDGRRSGTLDPCPGVAVLEINPQITSVTANSVGDARPPETALTAVHFGLTADDSQDESLADGMRGCEVTRSYRAGTTHRVKICCSASRWPVRRRRTCDARDTTQEHKENRAPTRRELQTMGGRVGFFVEWADIETEICTLEERRLECRELLGEMAIYEEDLNGAELKHYHDLASIAWWEHVETKDPERELLILRDGTRRLLVRLLHLQSAAPPKPVRRTKRPARRKR